MLLKVVHTEPTTDAQCSSGTFAEPGPGPEGAEEKKGYSQAGKGKVRQGVKKNDSEGHCALFSGTALHMAK